MCQVAPAPKDFADSAGCTGRPGRPVVSERRPETWRILRFCLEELAGEAVNELAFGIMRPHLLPETDEMFAV